MYDIFVVHELQNIHYLCYIELSLIIGETIYILNMI